MAKLNWTTLLVGAAFVLAFLGYASASGIAPYIIGIGFVVGLLGALNIYHLGTYSKSNHNLTLVLTALTAIVVLAPGLQMSGIMSGISSAPQTLSLDTPGNEQVQTTEGSTMQAALKFYPTDAVGNTYAGTGVVYALDPSAAADRFDFMKILADGQNSKLVRNGAQASPKSVSSGVFTWNNFQGKIGEDVELCGYLDTAPAAGDNVSWCKTIKLTGITAGSTPEWMFSGGDFNWRRYATTATWYDSSDIGRSRYIDMSSSAVEHTVRAYIFPGNNGEGVYNAALYIQSPAANAGAVKDVTIKGPTGASVVYTSLQSTATMSSTDPRFIAAPAVNTSAGGAAGDTQYYVGAFPEEAVKLGSSGVDKAVYEVALRYDHPASGDVEMFLSAVQNADAKTVSGGHFDFGQDLVINMTANTDAVTGWG